MHTTVHSRTDAWDAFRPILARLEHLLSGHEQLTDVHLDRLRSGVEGELSQSVYQLLLDAPQRAERRCAFSGGLAFRILAQELRQAFRCTGEEIPQHLRQVRARLESESAQLLRDARLPSLEGFQDVLEQYIPDSRLRTIVQAIVDNGGLDGKFTLESHAGTTTIVESTLGYNFNVHPVTEMGAWKRRDVKFVVIDGVIQDVHEIHHTLEAASTKKFPLVIAARGYGPDVVQTLQVNRKRGTIDVLPLQLPMEVEHLNTLKDIAVVANVELISTLKGQTAASADVMSDGCVNEVQYKPGLMTITNSSSLRAVQVHTAMLLDLRNKANAETRSFYEKRIKTLVPNHTTVRLPYTFNNLAVNSASSTVASGLRIVKALHEAGIIQTPKGPDLALRHVVARQFAASQLDMIARCDWFLLRR